MALENKFLIILHALVVIMLIWLLAVLTDKASDVIDVVVINFSTFTYTFNTSSLPSKTATVLITDVFRNDTGLRVHVCNVAYFGKFEFQLYHCIIIGVSTTSARQRYFTVDGHVVFYNVYDLRHTGAIILCRGWLIFGISTAAIIISENVVFRITIGDDGPFEAEDGRVQLVLDLFNTYLTILIVNVLPAYWWASLFLKLLLRLAQNMFKAL